MASLSDLALSGVYNAVTDFGADPSGAARSDLAINRAIIAASQGSPANGVVFLPPGTYRVDAAIKLKSNVELRGSGVGATTILLYSSIDGDCIVNDDQSAGNTAIRVADLTIDGNRANQTSQTGSCLNFQTVTRLVLDNVRTKSAQVDGLHIVGCENPTLDHCVADDNGNHGIALVNCQGHRLIAPDAHDNCRVTTAGNADGINLSLLTTDGVLSDVVAYDSYGGGKRQGYGVREAASSLCDRNLVMMAVSVDSATAVGNLTGAYSLDGVSSQALVGVNLTRPVRYVSAAYTAAPSDETVLVTAFAAVTVTLPTAVGISGKVYTVKKIDSGATLVTIATTSSQTIDAATTAVIGAQWQAISVRSDGVNWQSIGAVAKASIQTYTPAGAGTATLNLGAGDVHHITMPAGNVTIALTGETAGQTFLVRILQDSVGSRTVTWFSTIKWAGGSAPTLTTTAAKADTLSFEVTGTATYDGFVTGLNI